MNNFTILEEFYVTVGEKTEPEFGVLKIRLSPEGSDVWACTYDNDIMFSDNGTEFTKAEEAFNYGYRRYNFKQFGRR